MDISLGSEPQHLVEQTYCNEASTNENEEVSNNISLGPEPQKLVEQTYCNEASTNENEVAANNNISLGSEPQQLVEQTYCNAVSTNENEEVANISFMSEEEYGRIVEHQLTVAKEPENYSESPVQGNRIVQIAYLINKSIDLQFQHSKICTSGKLVIQDEVRRGNGLVSKINLKCNMCSRIYACCTEDPKKNNSKINIGLVWGTLASGSTFGHTTELISAMDIPSMPYSVFHEIENSLSESWKDALWENMENAGKIEKRMAIEAGQIGDDGVPWITVYLDGGWSKRSYGHNYTAASGVAMIIGKATGKLIFLGVRNKYCSICSRAANKQVTPALHNCYKNWSSSSSAMEADIIVEGFNCSQEMHGIKYTEFVADGDSSVFAKIQTSVVYGAEVNKIECKNHVVKNFGKSLYSKKKDTTIPKPIRQLLTGQKIKELQNAAQRCIMYNANGNVENLKKDFKNVPQHVYGNHTACYEHSCEDVGKISVDFIAAEKSGLILHINSVLDAVIRKSHRLINNETNNRAELLMAILARFNLGKRQNLIQRGSFETRSHLAGLRYNEGPTWQSSPWKKYMKESPGYNFKKYMEREKRSSEIRKRVKPTQLLHTNKRKISDITTKKDNNYGPKAPEGNLTPEEMLSERTRILNNLQVSQEIIKITEEETKGQFNNSLYRQHRKDRLTASNFGLVIKRRPSTTCHCLVKSILYGSNFSTPAINYGKDNESLVLRKLENIYKCTIHESGLFIDKKNGFLAESPDGLINDDTLVEVKCLYKVNQKGITLEEAAATDSSICLKLENGQLQLKKNHNYYYQVQGQLNIADREKCIFAVYCGEQFPMHIEIIKRDAKLWKEMILPKLIKFYNNCLLPEIINRRVPKGLKCLEYTFV